MWIPRVHVLARQLTHRAQRHRTPHDEPDRCRHPAQQRLGAQLLAEGDRVDLEGHERLLDVGLSRSGRPPALGPQGGEPAARPGPGRTDPSLRALTTTPPPRCPLAEIEEELTTLPAAPELVDAVRAWWQAAVPAVDRPRPGRRITLAPTAFATRCLLGRSRAQLLTYTTSPTTTTRLAALTGLSLGAVSQHLAVLCEAGLVTSHRYRREVNYAAGDLGIALLERT